MGENKIEILLPGDKLTDLINKESSIAYKLGPGLFSIDDDVISVCKPGIVKHGKKDHVWIESSHKRYVPANGDNVLGVVLNRGGEVYKVDVGASDVASLPWLAFEGATKRNRPDVEVGDVVYGRIVLPNKDMEPELSCLEDLNPKQGYALFHNEGYLFHCSLNLARRLHQRSCPLRKEMSHYIHGEIIIGLNGRIWVQGRSVEETLVIVDIIKRVEYLTDEQIPFVVRQLTETVKLFST